MALDDINLLRRELPEPGFDLFKDARDVVVIAMSGRSGSSWLVELLKGSQDLLHFRGELPTFLRLHGLFDIDKFGSEALGSEATTQATDELRIDLSRDLGRPLDRIEDAEDFAAACCMRVLLQWPALSLDAHHLQSLKSDIRDLVVSASSLDSDNLTTKIVHLVSQRHQVDLNYYDFGREPTGPITPEYWSTLWENPPFLCFMPWQMPNLEELKTKPLILKSCGDVHRLGFYKALFPNARFRIIHLVRNAAATVNGLIDGWLSRKYLCWRTPGLDIAGYTDTGETWRKNWWKFDAGPGWQNYRSAKLAEVCEFQWRCANSGALNWSETCASGDYIMLRYEDMISSDDSRRRQISILCDWLGIPDFDAGSGRIMNASVAPKPRRWKSREEVILPVLKQAQCTELSRQLAYSQDLESWL